MLWNSQSLFRLFMHKHTCHVHMHMHTQTCTHMYTHTHTCTCAHSVLSEADTLASRSQTPGLLDDSFVGNSEDRSALLQMLEEASCSSSDEGSEEEEIGNGGSKANGVRGVREGQGIGEG